MMLPFQPDLLTPSGTRFMVEFWNKDGKEWLPEVVKNTAEDAIKEGSKRMKCFPFVTWRVVPYPLDPDAYWSAGSGSAPR